MTGHSPAGNAERRTDIHPYAAGSDDSVFATTPRTDDRIRHVSPPRRHDAGMPENRAMRCGRRDADVARNAKSRRVESRSDSGDSADRQRGQPLYDPLEAAHVVLKRGGHGDTHEGVLTGGQGPWPV